MLEIAGGIIIAALFLMLFFAYMPQIIVGVVALFALSIVLGFLGVIYMLGGLDGVVILVIVLGLVFGIGYWNAQQDKLELDQPDYNTSAETEPKEQHETKDIILGYVASIALLIIVIGIIVIGYYLS